jgi:hypothetical protein
MTLITANTSPNDILDNANKSLDQIGSVLITESDIFQLKTPSKRKLILFFFN